MGSTIDIVMLPVDADPVDGEDLLDLIRRLTPASIIVVGPDNETEMVSTLFRGADAYFPFRFNTDIVRIRISSLLRLSSRTRESPVLS